MCIRGGTQAIPHTSLGVQHLHFNSPFYRENLSLSSLCLGTPIISKRQDRHYWKTRESNSKKKTTTDLLVTMITSSAIEDISLIVR